MQKSSAPRIPRPAYYVLLGESGSQTPLHPLGKFLDTGLVLLPLPPKMSNSRLNTPSPLGKLMYTILLVDTNKKKPYTIKLIKIYIFVDQSINPQGVICGILSFFALSNTDRRFYRQNAAHTGSLKLLACANAASL